MNTLKIIIHPNYTKFQLLSHRKISYPLKRPASQGFFYFMEEANDIHLYNLWAERRIYVTACGMYRPPLTFKLLVLLLHTLPSSSISNLEN
jgi:hypothetical protein